MSTGLMRSELTRVQKEYPGVYKRYVEKRRKWGKANPYKVITTRYSWGGHKELSPAAWKRKRREEAERLKAFGKYGARELNAIKTAWEKIKAKDNRVKPNKTHIKRVNKRKKSQGVKHRQGKVGIYFSHYQHINGTPVYRGPAKGLFRKSNNKKRYIAQRMRNRIRYDRI